MRLATPLGLAFVLLGFAGRVQACVISDPTGTPTNVRDSPGGAIVSTLGEGAQVDIVSVSRDRRGKSWALVGGAASGWVFRDFISCGTARTKVGNADGAHVDLRTTTTCVMPMRVNFPRQSCQFFQADHIRCELDRVFDTTTTSASIVMAAECMRRASRNFSATGDADSARSAWFQSQRGSWGGSGSYFLRGKEILCTMSFGGSGQMNTGFDCRYY